MKIGTLNRETEEIELDLEVLEAGSLIHFPPPLRQPFHEFTSDGLQVRRAVCIAGKTAILMEPIPKEWVGATSSPCGWSVKIAVPIDGLVRFGKADVRWASLTPDSERSIFFSIAEDK